MPRAAAPVAGPAPWVEWAEPRGSSKRAIRWIETYVILVKGHGAGKPINLAKHQKAWLRRVLDSEDADGGRLPVDVSIALLSVARGNGKSTFMAAVALWFLFDPPSDSVPQVPIVATTVKQAMRAIWKPACLMVKRHPELERRSRLFTSITDPKILCLDNDGEMFPIADDPDGLQGLDPTLAVLDEIGHHPASSWNALVLASGKDPDSVIVGCGTVGPRKIIRGENNALHVLDQAHIAGQLDDGVVFVKYSAPEGCDIDDPDAWRAANPAIDEGYLDVGRLLTAASTSPVHEVRMFRLNQWTSGVGSWLGDDAAQVWGELYDDGYHFHPAARTWVGVDIGTTHDSTAVVAMQRREDDPSRWHAVFRIWMPGDGRRVDLDDVGRYLVELADTYDLVEVAYDPRSFRDAAAKLLDEDGLPMVEFPQSVARMAPATATAHGLVTTGGLSWSAHDADQRGLVEWQITNAQARYLDEGGFRVSKSKSEEKIDATIGLVVCADRAATTKPKRKRTYYGGVVR